MLDLVTGSKRVCRIALLAPIFGAAALDHLDAQAVVIQRALKNATTQKDQLARSMLSNQKAFAATSDGRLWALTWFDDGSWNDTNTLSPQRDLARHLELHSSRDGGQSWTRVTEARTTGDAYGSLVVGPDGRTLHLCWYAWNGQKDATNFYTSVFYAAFDTRSDAWVGADHLLVQGFDSVNQTYSTPDIAVTSSGVIGVVFSSARAVPSGWVGGTGAWHSGLCWKKGANWSAPHRINDDGSGVLANISAHGDDFHMCYRVTTGGYGVSYRRFDTTTETFGAEGELPVVPSATNPRRNISNLYANNASHVAIDVNGDVYVLYSTGTSSTGGGKLFYVHAAAGSYTFGAPIEIDDDTSLGWGNNTYRSFDLARSADGGITAVYSKRVEKHKTLYMRILRPTAPVPPRTVPALTLRAGADDEFQQLCAQTEVLGGREQLVQYSDLRPFATFTGGAVFGFGKSAGMTVFHGAACSGAKSFSPSLRGASLPTLGATFTLALGGHPPQGPGALLLGLDDTKLFGAIPLPLDMVPFGMPGCSLTQDVVLTFAYATNANGEASLPLPLPNDTNLVGLPLHWQAYVIVVAANAGNAVVSNGLTMIPR